MYCCFTHIKWEWWANEYWEFPNYMIVQLIYSILHDVFQPICLGFCLFYELVKINSHQMFLSNQAVGSWDASVSWWSFEPKSINKWMDKMDTNGQTWTKWRDSVNANSNARILFYPINKVCSAWTKTEGVTPKRGEEILTCFDRGVPVYDSSVGAPMVHGTLWLWNGYGIHVGYKATNETGGGNGGHKCWKNSCKISAAMKWPSILRTLMIQQWIHQESESFWDRFSEVVRIKDLTLLEESYIYIYCIYLGKL